jgi:4-amino-4-deoxy-L-arabinose transferase-like glycosyltransferase
MTPSWAAFLHRPFVHIPFLLILGCVAFGWNVSISLFGETEGTYAIITHAMMERQEYVPLWLRGYEYFSKPPLFFWFQAGFIHALGWSETALRLPSMFASLGTMMVTYGFGRLLFSRVLGRVGGGDLLCGSMVWPIEYHRSRPDVLDDVGDVCLGTGLF